MAEVQSPEMAVMGSSPKPYNPALYLEKQQCNKYVNQHSTTLSSIQTRSDLTGSILLCNKLSYEQQLLT